MNKPADSAMAAALDAQARWQQAYAAQIGSERKVHNLFGRVVEAAEAGCTHGEICATLRRELGFGHVQAMV